MFSFGIAVSSLNAMEVQQPVVLLSTSAPSRFLFGPLADNQATPSQHKRRGSTGGPLVLNKNVQVGFDPQGVLPPTPVTSPIKQVASPRTPEASLATSTNAAAEAENSWEQKMATLTEPEKRFVAAVVVYNQQQPKTTHQAYSSSNVWEATGGISYSNSTGTYYIAHQ